MDQRKYQDKLITLTPDNKLTYEFNNKETNDLTWSENLLGVTAEHKKINVCCSGGLDSDVILRLFAKHKKVTCFIGRWMNDGVCYNDYDIKHAIDSCESLGIDYKFIDLDFEKFFESGEFINYGTVYRSTSPQLCLHLKLFDEIEEDLAIGGNYFSLDKWNNRPVLAPENSSIIYDLYFSSKGYDLGNLHYYNCATASSTFKHTILAQRNLEKENEEFNELSKLHIDTFDSVDQETKDKWGESTTGCNYLKSHLIYIVKMEQYRLGGFDVLSKGHKYTGFEGVKRYFSDKYNEQQNAFDNKFRRHLENIVSIPTLQIDIIEELTNIFGDKEWQNS